MDFNFRVDEGFKPGTGPDVNALKLFSYIAAIPLSLQFGALTFATIYNCGLKDLGTST